MDPRLIVALALAAVTGVALVIVGGIGGYRIGRIRTDREGIQKTVTAEEAVRTNGELERQLEAARVEAARPVPDVTRLRELLSKREQGYCR